ncbi:uncharacterized protein LOC134231937 [Saccostrea cucullata]|uniref:uncharacterized protein LOC134231937 n=1 Tax=Saccostrea cuccullata TaxID=36930 RepID=UPI002ED14EBF
MNMLGAIFLCLLASVWGVALGGDKMYTAQFVITLMEKIDRLEKEFSLFKEETATKLQEFQTKLEHSDQTVKELEDRLQLSDKKVGELTRDLEHSEFVLLELVKQRQGGSNKDYPFPPDEQKTNDTNPNYNEIQKAAVPIEIKQSQDRFQRLLIPATQFPQLSSVLIIKPGLARDRLSNIPRSLPTWQWIRSQSRNISSTFGRCLLLYYNTYQWCRRDCPK